MVHVPILPFEDERAWEAWLEANHASSDGLWLKLAKKDSGHASITYDEALTVALCFGWIDGQKKGQDDQYWLQKFTPRRKNSIWSTINRDKVTALIAQGRMREAGLREIESAKQDGRWDAAYQPQSKAAMPEEFMAALAQNAAAHDFYGTLNSANRYAIYHRITTAKKPETRQRLIAQFVEMLAKGEKLY